VTKLRLSLLSIIGLILVLGGYTQRHTLACEFIGYSSYSEIAPNVFASTSFNLDKKGELLFKINQGKSRVDDTFGNMGSKPKVVIATNKVEASDLGSNEYGRMLYSPLGECIVLGPEGQNVDVIAHEFMHAEVHFRVGWLKFISLPTWFNEGIGTLVDFRKPYLLENIDLPQEEVNSIKDNPFNFKLNNYQASRVLVDNINKSKLYANLEKLKQGQDISSVFGL
jgi:hypothetical protein